MSLGQRRVGGPPASGWSRMSIEIYKVEPRRMPRYSRMSYHQKGPRTSSCRTSSPFIVMVSIVFSFIERAGEAISPCVVPVSCSCWAMSLPPRAFCVGAYAVQISSPGMCTMETIHPLTMRAGTLRSGRRGGHASARPAPSVTPLLTCDSVHGGPCRRVHPRGGAPSL
jgi:hypothetical protein